MLTRPTSRRARRALYEALEPRRLLAAGLHHWPAGPEVQVNSFPNGGQSAPVMAMDADEDYVVAWQSYAQDGVASGIYAQRFSAAGVPQGGEFRVNTDTSLNEIQPAVAMDADGDFVVTWSRGYSSYNYDVAYDVRAQRYNAAGVPQGTEFV